MEISLMELLYTLSLKQKILIIYKSHAINEITNVSNIIENNTVKFIDIDTCFGGLLREPIIKYFKIYIE